MIRILHILSDTHTGAGPANSLLTLLDYLPSNQYKSYVALREAGTLSDELRERTIRCLFLSLPKPVGVDAFYFFSRFPCAVLYLVSFIRKHKIDVVHVHQCQSIWGLIAGRLAGVSIVFHAREMLGNRFYKRALLHLPTQIIAISKAVASWLNKGASHSVKSKISVVYNAVDLKRFDPAKCNGTVRGELGIGHNVPMVIMVSKLVENKGHLDFVKSCMLVKEQYHEAVFAIVGGELPRHEWYAEKVKRTVNEAGLTKVLHLVGFRRDVEKFLAASDVVVQPSTWEEPLGRVPLEAMALGKPVVATAVGGIPEVVVDGVTGYLVPKGDPEALATRIIKLLSNSGLRRRFGEAGRRRICEQFNARNYASDITKIYREVVGCAPEA